MILEFLQGVGPFVFPLILLAIVIVFLALISARRLWDSDPVPAERLRGGVDAILFWGAFAAMLGFLGQWTGLYKGFRAVAELGLSPACAENPARCYALGFAESLSPTIFGLAVFLVAGLLWFVLRSRVRRLTWA